MPDTAAILPTGLDAVPAEVRAGRPMLWRNPGLDDARAALAAGAMTAADYAAACTGWGELAPLLARLFPELATTGGRIDSPLLQVPADRARAVTGGRGRLLVKADHMLPVAGSIKARGGIYEVLVHAVELARREGLLPPEASPAQLAEPEARRLFARHRIVTGSTGNLGFSIGLAGRALGFAVDVHMSHDAKAWKKQRLRDRGVNVVEHSGDYGLAVRQARAAADADANAYFVDDEDSERLFLGYAAAAAGLKAQLAERDIAIGPTQRLRVYLPCGVGGAPGGITFGLKHEFGDDVDCILVEPVASPCMLVQLAAGLARPVSVYDIGLDNRTLADGLAVASASMLVARAVHGLVAGVATVTDAELLAWVGWAWRELGLRLEPSAASGLAAARAMSAAGSEAVATELAWTTGGGLLPDDEFDALLAGAAAAPVSP